MWFTLQLLSAFAWALLNVLNSVVVRHYEKRPYVLQWHQSLFTLTILAVFALTHSFDASWAAALIIAGAIAYVGDFVYFLSIRAIDVSVTNIAWAMLAVLLSIIGFLFFGETWTTLQTTGAVMVLAGVLLLSLWHRRIGEPRALFFLPLLALLYTPFFAVQKAALLDGQSVSMVFFWPLLGREVLCGAVPMLVPRLRRRVFSVVRTLPVAFPLLNGVIVSLFFLATFLTTEAFATGPLSLVSVVGNVQPFFVLFVAWLLWVLYRERASREMLTRDALGVKIASFLVVFAGLALLAVPQ